MTDINSTDIPTTADVNAANNPLATEAMHLESTAIAEVKAEATKWEETAAHVVEQLDAKAVKEEESVLDKALASVGEVETEVKESANEVVTEATGVVHVTLEHFKNAVSYLEQKIQALEDRLADHNTRSGHKI